MKKKSLITIFIFCLMLMMGCSKKENIVTKKEVEIQKKTETIIIDGVVPKESVVIEEESINKWENEGKMFINYSAKIRNKSKKSVLIRDLKIKLVDVNENEILISDITLITPDVIEHGKVGYLSETFELEDKSVYEKVDQVQTNYDNSYTVLKAIPLKIEEYELEEDESGNFKTARGKFINKGDVIAKDVRIVGALYTEDEKGNEKFYGNLFQMYSGSLEEGQSGFFELKYPELPPIKTDKLMKIEIKAYEWIGE